MSQAPTHAGNSVDLAALEAAQRKDEIAPDAPVRLHTRGVRIPKDGAIPQSAAWLERLYADEVVAREKKPQVIDTRRSLGPYLVSVDDDPMVLLDACSQIATVTHGARHPKMVRDLYDGRFKTSLWSNPDTTVGDGGAVLADYGAALLAHAPRGLTEVCFTAAGGAEANEKAFRIARMQHADGAKRRRVLAFENGFHGRTHVSLMSTWNVVKRGPFELDGYESVFCPLDLDALEQLLAARGGEIYAAIIEPMMAEGGDVHLTQAFLRGVRALTRAHGIPLIADEVQTGFCTGGEFFWWNELGLGDDPETAPDLLTSAKKSGLGVVLSRWPDPEPTPVCAASALRGLIQLETAHEQRHLESSIPARLEALAAAHPELVTSPRGSGTTFAFDLPDSEHQAAFIAQRFQRGFMTYQAGPRTIRFRLNATFDEAALDDLFARVDAALRRLQDPTARDWIEEGKGVHTRPGGITVREVVEEDWAHIMAIEYEVYEPARVDDEQELRSHAALGVGLVATDEATGAVLGFSFASPVEENLHKDGPRDDDRVGRKDTLYSIDVTVSPKAQGRGAGLALKSAQLAWARQHGYSFVTGRNRVGATAAMAALNNSLGAFLFKRLEHQYEGDAQADYYRIPLLAPAAAVASADARDLASGLQAPFGPAPAFMATRELVGPTCTRLNLSNWTTPDIIHYVEHLKAILPRGTRHLYFTSSRDETVDKGLRCLRVHRPGARIAVGVEGGFVGNITAAARSISDPRGFGDCFDVFDWPSIPHPCGVEGARASVEALEGIVATHGADALYGLVIETVGERSGMVLEGDGATELAEACRRLGVPLVMVETASGLYRGGAGPWGVDGLPASVVPDMVLWSAGGQLGHVFVSDALWVGKPLTLISTWDGDELCVIRTHEALRAAWRLDMAPAIAALDAAVRAAASRVGGCVGGLGLYRTIAVPDALADAFGEALAAEGVHAKRGLPTVWTFCPRLDVAAEEIESEVAPALMRAAVATAG